MHAETVTTAVGISGGIDGDSATNLNNSTTTTSNCSALSLLSHFCNTDSPTTAARFSIKKKLSETLLFTSRSPRHTLSSSAIDLAAPTLLSKFTTKRNNEKCSSQESLRSDSSSLLLNSAAVVPSSARISKTQPLADHRPVPLAFVPRCLAPGPPCPSSAVSSAHIPQHSSVVSNQSLFRQFSNSSDLLPSSQCPQNISLSATQSPKSRVEQQQHTSADCGSCSLVSAGAVALSSVGSSVAGGLSAKYGANGEGPYFCPNSGNNELPFSSTATATILPTNLTASFGGALSASGAITIAATSGGYEPSPGGPTTSSSTSSASSTSTQGPTANKGYRPDEALRIFGSKLTPYEHTELFSYQRVYFVGSQAKKRLCVAGGANNSNFDDENGSYTLVSHDHIAYRYEILKVIGKGSFGQVIKAYDHKHQQYVALKLVRNEKRFHRQAEEEIRILDHLKKQDGDGSHNVIHMLDHFTFRNHKCITFELMSINLYELIKKNKFQGFNLTLVRKFAHSMLQCLELLHRNHLIHCDLKPENVLLKMPNRSSIKVIDFGSSCFDDQRIYTYIQSRFYRAPEVILGAKYGMPIDMWSLGCILAELLTGYPLLPGEDENDQLALVIELLGMPNPKLLEGAKRSRNFFSSKGHPRYCQVTQLMDGTTVLTGGRSKRGKLRGPPGSRTMQSALKNQGDDLFLDFLKRCLDWDPEARMTPGQALKHPWLRRRLPRLPVGGGTDTADSALLLSSSILK
ncbi:hypothetical protein niasHT_015796 [Heterodera trifolii]|uniref:Dual specificity tyrosine-phosphorylation-regulated kinase mbk-2 n=1 Tax=Heterodera trifolii TaxID=157864 RepID=A0ABD2L4X6_9BILA